MTAISETRRLTIDALNCPHRQLNLKEFRVLIDFLDSSFDFKKKFEFNISSEGHMNIRGPQLFYSFFSYAG